MLLLRLHVYTNDTLMMLISLSIYMLMRAAISNDNSTASTNANMKILNSNTDVAQFISLALLIYDNGTKKFDCFEVRPHFISF